MAVVFIPTLLHPLTGGLKQVQAAGTTLRQVITDVDRQFPGVGERVMDSAGIRPEILLAIGADEAFSIDEAVGPDTEVHILPAIAGG